MSRVWKCQKCGVVLSKDSTSLEDAIKRGSNVSGMAVCGYCGAKYSKRDVYSGKYDILEIEGLLEPHSCKSSKKWWQFWK